MGLEIDNELDLILDQIKRKADRSSDLVSGYLDDRIEIMRSETDVTIRQLETLSPVINRYRCQRMNSFNKLTSPISHFYE